MFPYASYLAVSDPEAVGAHASLLLFGVFAAIVCVTTSIAFMRRAQHGGRIASFAIGWLGALAFFASLQFVHFAGFVVTLFIALLVMLLAVSLASSLWSQTRKA